jgi:hypothetical protein
MRSSMREASHFLALALVACGGVAKSDPGFWEPSKDPGGTQVDFTQQQGGPPPPGSGGQSYGGGINYPPPGSGGQFVGGGGMGQAGAGFGSGGFQDQGAGGAQFGAGGSNPFGSGGFQNQGSGGAQQGAGGAPPAGNSGPCVFNFTVTTVTAHGNYAPNNVGALWIETSSGTFVKALEVWGRTRLPNLTAFSAVGGNSIDAVTSATHTNHRQHADHWDCTDTSKNPVVNGSYQACVSFAEDDAIPFFSPPPHLQCAPFDKGSGPFSTNPAATANFTGWSLVMQ